MEEEAEIERIPDADLDEDKVEKELDSSPTEEFAGFWTFDGVGSRSYSASVASSLANESQHSETSLNVFDLNILICGKSGNGKSSVGNFLLGYDRFLTGFLGTNLNEPLHCEVGETKMQFKSAGLGTLRIIDTPGLFDLDCDPMETLSTMGQVTYSLPGGLHAFIFVLPYNQSLTDDDAQILGEMSQFFSKSMLKYTFFLLNGSHTENVDTKNLDFLPGIIKTAIEKSTQKVWLINPLEESEEVVQESRRRVLSDIIDNLNRVGRPYESSQLTVHHAKKQEQNRMLKVQRDLDNMKAFQDDELMRLRKENNMRAELMTTLEFESFNDTGIGRKVFIEVEKECKRRQFTDSTCPVQ